MLKTSGSKIIAGVIVLAALMIASGAVSYRNISSMKSAKAQLALTQGQVGKAYEVKFCITDVNGWQTAYGYDAGKSRSAFQDSAKSCQASVDAFVAAVAGYPDEPTARAIASDFGAFMKLDDQTWAAGQKSGFSPESEAGKLILGANITAFQKLTRDVQGFIDAQTSELEGANSRFDSAASLSNTFAIGGLILSALLAGGLLFFIWRGVIRPTRILQDDLKEAVDVVRASAEHLARASEETGMVVNDISQSMQSVAETAERQASSSVEALNAADEAHAVADVGVAAAASVAAAIRQVREQSETATVRIDELGAKSDQIGGIIETITGIADQTNLLALNAAIEAARAGEQGRGFAVVAEEVRKLAEESRRAAESIAGLVAEVQASTREAVAVVRESGEAINASVEKVDAAHEAFTSIVGQASTVRDVLATINREIEGTAAVTEEVNAATEQTSATAQNVSSQAEELHATAERLAELAGTLNI